MGNKTCDIKFLNRFTSISYMLDMLKREVLVFPPYEKWPDQNDVSMLNHYSAITNYKTIRSICFTSGRETIHHWSNLSSIDSLCCIEFNYQNLISLFGSETDEIIHDKVEYYTLDEAKKKTNFSSEKYLFSKRKPYEVEEEYRIVYRSNKEETFHKEVKINYECINKITLNANAPSSIRDLIYEITGKDKENDKDFVNTSSILKYDDWINAMKCPEN